MSRFAGWMGSTAGVAAGAGVLVAVVVGASLYFGTPGEQDAPQVASAPAPSLPAEPSVPALAERVSERTQVEEASGEATVPEPAPAPETAALDEAASPPPAPPTPSIDEVRVEEDGLAIIAGRAVPGSKVTVLLDGVAETEVMADEAGGFAAVTIIAPNPDAQVLSLNQRADGKDLASLDEVIIAPIAVPRAAVVAAAPRQDEGLAAEDDIAEAADEAVAPAAEVASTDTAQTTPPAASEADPAADSETQIAAVQEPRAAPQTEQAEPATASDTEEVAAADAPQPLADVDAPTLSDTTQVADAPEIASAQTSPQAVLKSTEEGVIVLGTRPPSVLENIELDTISYGADGAVELAGRAQPDAEVVRVYVDNRPIADIEVDAEGRWRGALPQIDTGVYTLRVDELDADGTVTSRQETPFLREDPQVLAQVDTPDAPAKRITVQRGNTLWGISRDRYGEGRLYVQVFDANRDRIRDPDLIFPGQIFDLPETNE